MAKREINMSEEIRKIATSKGITNAAEIVEALAAKKIKVSKALVYNVLNAKGGKKANKGSNGQGEMTMLFVLKNGGNIDALKTKLQKLKTNDPLVEFAIARGGVDSAVQSLEDLAAKLNPLAD